jgi:hypothetical protein
MKSTPDPTRPARRPLSPSERAEQKLERALARALAPFDRRALGIAVGTTCALGIAGLTVASMLVDTEGRFPLNLLANYFRGYRVSWLGAGVGALWAFVAGFCGGWFLAFARNLIVTLWIMKVRIAADVKSSREVLDHI